MVIFWWLLAHVCILALGEVLWVCAFIHVLIRERDVVAIDRESGYVVHPSHPSANLSSLGTGF